MAQVTEVRVDIDELDRLLKRMDQLHDNFESAFADIDRSIQDLQLHWAGESKRAAFFTKAEGSRVGKEDAIKKLRTVFDAAMVLVPQTYTLNELTNNAEAKKLVSNASK